MSDEAFESIVAEGIAALPLWVQEQLTRVVFLVADEPSPTQRISNGLGSDDLLFGLYEGVPLTERGEDAVLMPDTITLFKKSILDTYDTDADIRACIHNTVWHEVAHYFGRDEEWVAAEEERRGKIL